MPQKGRCGPRLPEPGSRWARPGSCPETGGACNADQSRVAPLGHPVCGRRVALAEGGWERPRGLPAVSGAAGAGGFRPSPARELLVAFSLQGELEEEEDNEEKFIPVRPGAVGSWPCSVPGGFFGRRGSCRTAPARARCSHRGTGVCRAAARPARRRPCTRGTRAGSLRAAR